MNQPKFRIGEKVWGENHAPFEIFSVHAADPYSYSGLRAGEYPVDDVPEDELLLAPPSVLARLLEVLIA